MDKAILPSRTMYQDVFSKRLHWLRLAAAVTVVASVRWLTAFALGQYSTFQPPGPTPVYRTPQSYADFFNEQLQSYQPPSTDARNYIINRYFYHSPTISPYLNLTRRTSPDSINNYYRYVRPEIERRQQLASSTGRAPLAAQPSFAPSAPAAPMPQVSSGHLPQQNPYFNQFYNFGTPQPAPGQLPPKPLPKLLP